MQEKIENERTYIMIFGVQTKCEYHRIMCCIATTFGRTQIKHQS